MDERIETRRVFYEHVRASHKEHYGEPTEIQSDYMRQLVYDLVEDLGFRPLYAAASPDVVATAWLRDRQRAEESLRFPRTEILRKFESKPERAEDPPRA